MSHKLRLYHQSRITNKCAISIPTALEEIQFYNSLSFQRPDVKHFPPQFGLMSRIPSAQMHGPNELCLFWQTIHKLYSPWAVPRPPASRPPPRPCLHSVSAQRKGWNWSLLLQNRSPLLADRNCFKQPLCHPPQHRGAHPAQHQSGGHFAEEITRKQFSQLLAAPGNGTSTPGRKVWHLEAVCLNRSVFFTFVNTFFLLVREGQPAWESPAKDLRVLIVLNLYLASVNRRKTVVLKYFQVKPFTTEGSKLCRDAIITQSKAKETQNYH